jgi:hypothetical protein
LCCITRRPYLLFGETALALAELCLAGVVEYNTGSSRLREEAEAEECRGFEEEQEELLLLLIVQLG